MAKIGKVYAGTKYVTLDLVLSNGDREDLVIEISEFIGIQNKLIAAQQSVHPTVRHGSQNWVDGCHCSACEKNNPALSHSG